MFHSIYFKVGVGKAPNNFYKLMAFILVLILAREHGVTYSNILGFTPCNLVDETRVIPKKFHASVFVSLMLYLYSHPSLIFPLNMFIGIETRKHIVYQK